MASSQRVLAVSMVGVFFTVCLLYCLSPTFASEQKPVMTPGPETVPALALYSETADEPPPAVLTQVKDSPDCPVPFWTAYIALACCEPDPAAAGAQVIEVWSYNAGDCSRMLFNHFTLTLSDGSQVEESIGRDVAPGEWLHVSCRIPANGPGMTEYQVELTEPAPFIDYVHDCESGTLSTSRS